jgi:TolB-like protein/tRNA A-37 threonylcarbamoyl transferase component Bud32
MALTSSQLGRLSRLLDEALSLDAAGRRAWLQRLLPENKDLAGPLLKALLPGEPLETIFLSPFSKLEAGAETGPVAVSGLEPGTHVGPYQLLRLLGVGGMAEVWLARRADGAFKREVALKLPMLTRMRKDLEQRFIRERDILASLEHPHIARLYDAGIDADGLPYLSMEFVQGQQLTSWCDAHLLGISERLSLFLQVLDAVQYAHGKQVIHRDLKPSNILVTAEKQVRLLDFGVAKLLQGAETEPETQITSVYGRALTPVYASPEMLRGDPIDARSDIYALGVLLYELLTGARPYRLNGSASAAMQERAIAMGDVKRPSRQLDREAGAMRATSQEQLARRLRGDLDAITLMALAKEPQARYSSAAAFADDVQRHLLGRPVRARRAGLAYRLRKFVLRNSGVIAVTVTAAAAVLGTIGYMLHREAVNHGQIGTSNAAIVTGAPKVISEKSVAVLPFLDLSEGKDQGYFSDGLSEELIVLLAQTQGLQVIARTSSFYFKGKQVATSQIAKELGVAHLLEGSVRRSGHTVRVTAQLLRADSGEPLWSETYDRDVHDIFQVQDYIAAAVVGALKLKLLPAQQVVDPNRSENHEAYNQFLLGRQFFVRGTSEGYRRAAAAYRKATVLDPGYAAAYAGLSLCETKIANYTLDAAGFERARDAAEKALALAPQLIDGYRARAYYRRETLDFAGARADGDKALAIAPGDSMVRSFYGVGQALFGRIAEATVAMNRAIELDPLNSYAWANLGLFLTAARDYPAARRALERAIAINQEDYSFHMALGQLDMLEGRLQEALTEFQAKGSEVGRLMGEAMIEHARGQDSQSLEAIKDLIAKHALDATYQIGEVYAWRGENDRAFEWLQRAYQQRDSGLNGILYDPLLTGLVGDPRFKTLLKKLKLSE